MSWKLSNSLDSAFCIDALDEALARYGTPEMFDTDQGSQFTSERFIKRLELNDIRISMDGQGRWRDNVFVERLWKSVKYAEVYLHAYANPKEAQASLTRYFAFYNTRRPHRALDGQTPDGVYFNSLPLAAAA